MPEQNLNQVVDEITGVSASTSVNSIEQNDGEIHQDKPKKNKGMILEMVLLGLLAVGGIGFGVWAMIDGNAQKEQLNSQISALKSQNNELQEKVVKLEDNSKAQLENAGAQNQVEKTEDQTNVENIEEAETNEEGYKVISIGDCVFDSGTGAGGVEILKCEAETSLGKGKFVWDSERNKLFFATPSEN